MKFYGLDPIIVYCQACGNKIIGYKSRDQTVRTVCTRCGAKAASKKVDFRTVETRLTVPYWEQALF